MTSTDASYFFNNVMRGLYSYTNEFGLKSEGAKDCRFESTLRLICRLDPTSKWSDGSPVVAEDYVRSFRKLLGSTSKNPSVELLKRVKNALAFHSGKVPASELGVRADGKERLLIDFETPDPDFLLKLTSSVLVPIKTETYPKRGELSGVLFNGPYQVVSWSLGRRLRLEPNPHYDKNLNKKRPPVEILFIDDDQTALHLYEKGDLSFLRRLPTNYIKSYRSRADFKQIPVARFDYIGFGEELRSQPDLRAALALSADYAELARVYDALGMPGCPSLPEELIDRPRCISFNLARAKEHLAKVAPEVRQRRFKLFFSKLGGDDIKKGMEWYQAQWKKNLGLQIDLEQTEQAVYLSLLRNSPPAIFRKGVGLERPTCLAALETFSRGGSENFLNLDDRIFEDLLIKLAAAIRPIEKTGMPDRFPSPEAKRICGEGVQHLLDRWLFVPQGRIHFTLLANPNFKGWHLNEMNQLDLVNLEALTYSRDSKPRSKL